MKIRHLKFSEDLNSKYLTNEFILFFFLYLRMQLIALSEIEQFIFA